VLAVLAVLLFAWLIFKPASPHPAPVPNRVSNEAANPAPLPAPAPAAQVEPKPSPAKPIAKPENVRPAPLRAAVPAATPEAAGGKKVWRVVAYTYHRQDQAQHKANEVNQAHPDLHATVFSPNGDPNHFLVVLGGATDSRGAFAMRDKAIHSGLAADTYVQGFEQ
jgi:hypothetical protein